METEIAKNRGVRRIFSCSECHQTPRTREPSVPRLLRWLKMARGSKSVAGAPRWIFGGHRRPWSRWDLDGLGAGLRCVASRWPRRRASWRLEMAVLGCIAGLWTTVVCSLHWGHSKVERDDGASRGQEAAPSPGWWVLHSGHPAGAHSSRRWQNTDSRQAVLECWRPWQARESDAADEREGRRRRPTPYVLLVLIWWRNGD